MDSEGELDRDLDATPVRYGPRPPVPTKLDAYKGIIEARLAAYPQLSAVRLLEEIRATGYAGGYAQLKAFVPQVRPASGPAPVIRFETPAGRQAQVDFARFRFAWGVRYALLVALDYSRLLWCRFYPRQDLRTLVSGLEEAQAAGRLQARSKLLTHRRCSRRTRASRTGASSLAMTSWWRRSLIAWSTTATL